MNTPPLARILIVDDEEAVMRALADTLRHHGFETAGYTSGHAALAALRETKFDLLLSDAMMPGIDGISVLRSALGIDPNLVGIIMTGEGTISTAVEAMKTGAFDYILKPFKLSAILPVLSRAVALRKLRLENAALERRVRQRTDQLEAANEELEAFANSVSHDLRAPLRHISGFLELILNSNTSTLSKTDQDYMNRVRGTAQLMGRMIADLLEFSRMGRAELAHSQVDLSALLEEVIQEHQPEVAGRRINWKKSSLPSVQADPAMLRLVLSNLILNAIKFTRTRPMAEIEIGCQPTEADETVIFVRDNGVGFDMKTADRLFTVFQRLHRQEEFEGTGVGLSTVRRIIARHGGRTWAEGKVNEGATFYFSLPRHSPAFPLNSNLNEPKP